MHKTVILIRHAKSSWSLPLKDKLRPLNARGYQQAGNIAEQLAHFPQPERIYCSTAIRTYTTCQLILEQIRADESVLGLMDELYDANASQLIRCISATPVNLNCVYLVGHNPGLDDLVRLLTGESISIKTSGWVALSINGEWEQFAPGTIKILGQERTERLA